MVKTQAFQLNLSNLDKPRDIYDPVPGTLNKIQKEDLRSGQKQVEPVSHFPINSGRIIGYFRRRFLFSALLLMLTFSALAPENNSVVISKAPLINPFTELIYATGMVETLGNTAAYNALEDAVGIFQIRQVRVDDYNRRTGSSYRLVDMYDYAVSEEVFLYFASLAGPYDFEKIARSWNGSGPMTDIYWKRIKTYLD